MGKIAVEIDDKLEERLRRYIINKFSTKYHGKLSKIVAEAIKEWLDRHEAKHND